MRVISRFIAAVASAGLLATGVMAAAPASAATARLAPHTYTYHSLLVHRADKGGAGNAWAYDTLHRTLTIRLLGPAAPGTGGLSGTVYKYMASISDSGRFVTIPGALAPNQGAFKGSKIARMVGGSVWGYGKWGVFYANALPTTRPAPFQYGNANPSGTWPQLAFATGTAFSGVNESSYGYFYNAQFKIHRSVIVTIKTGSKMTLSKLAASRHMTVRQLLRLNPKLARHIGKKVPKGTKVRVPKVITVTIHQHWADTSYNGDGQTFRAGNITGFAR